MFEPGGETGVSSGGGRDFAGDVEEDGEFEFVRELDPFVVDRAPLGVCRGDGQGELGVLRGEGCEEAELAEVFAADAADRVEDEILIAVGGAGRGFARSGDCVGEEVALLCRDAGLDEEVEIAGVDEGVVDLGGEGVELVVVFEEAVVARASVFGEIVVLEQKALFGFEEVVDESGEGAAFAEGGIVEVPEVRGLAEGFLGGGTELRGEVGVVVGVVVEFGVHDDGELVWSLVGSAGKNDVFDAGGLEGGGLRFEDAGDSTGAEVIVDEGDRHF